MGVVLEGMTWSHSRGYEPLVACAGTWSERVGVEVRWERRSLQDFESFPVEKLARRFDLIVIDHPHVGQVAQEGCLRPFDDPDKAKDRIALARASVGPSWESYLWRGQQMALPIDAAAQVQAWRSDLILEPARTWNEALAFARRGAVLIPMRPPHSLMAFYTLAANVGRPCAVEGPDLVDPSAGAEALGTLREMTSVLDPRCFDIDPINVLEAMTAADSPIVCAPLIYGYAGYSTEGVRERRIRFADIPGLGAAGPVGSALGGTGIAVSALRPHVREASDFAYWVASGEVQSGVYAASGGQPAHAAAWDSDVVNANSADFYRATRRTLEGAWIRPRHDGYLPFQDKAARLLNAALRDQVNPSETIARINALFRDSLGAGGR
jgi:multiple sugar transport system substrate-binding protein